MEFGGAPEAPAKSEGGDPTLAAVRQAKLKSSVAPATAGVAAKSPKPQEAEEDALLKLFKSELNRSK